MITVTKNNPETLPTERLLLILVIMDLSSLSKALS
jgi:hypothetical protein